MSFIQFVFLTFTKKIIIFFLEKNILLKKFDQLKIHESKRIFKKHPHQKATHNIGVKKQVVLVKHLRHFPLTKVNPENWTKSQNPIGLT